MFRNLLVAASLLIALIMTTPQTDAAETASDPENTLYLEFHRVIGGFRAQTGDPTGTGRGGSGQNLDAEFSDEPHVRGTLSMARSSDPDSADSQFFIVYARASYLDGAYTVWGKVKSGMVHVGKIKRGEPAEDPDKIITMRVAADVKE
jgi:peptidylprolyl isomerase